MWQNLGGSGAAFWNLFFIFDLCVLAILFDEFRYSKMPQILISLRYSAVWILVFFNIFNRLALLLDSLEAFQRRRLLILGGCGIIKESKFVLKRDIERVIYSDNTELQRRL